MNLQRFEFFLVLSETLNYTETAERLYTTQGNVSKQILALEKELGITLFNRSHRSISLTEEGRIACGHAQKILDEMKQLTAALDQYKQKTERSITIFGVPTMPNYHISSLIGEFHHLYPDSQFIIEESESDVLLKHLENDECDLIFGRDIKVDLQNYRKLTLEKDRLVAVLPQEHPLANRKILSLQDLQNETFLQLGQSTQMYQPILDLCQKAGFSPNISYHGKRASLIINFVANGMGVSLMMEKIVKGTKKATVVLVPLDIDVESEMDVICKKKQSSKMMQTFWNFIGQHKNFNLQ